MNIRVIDHNDIDQLRYFQDKFFKNEFEFPDFFNNFLSSFVVTDDDGKIITGGGVRVIAESIIITDKNHEIKERRKALHEMLTASAYVANVRGHNQLHAFVQDENWERHLKRAGFREIRGKGLILNL